MTLTPGTHLGPYEIVGQIGAGGMGEVWKALDTRLDRLVAVKVLPEHFATAPDSLARFEREAKAVAALNHPNILGIYDFGTDGEHTYAVMELLEGKSLRERLKAGPMDPEQVLEIAQQVAAGLTVAHAKGIVHRDIKPENIFLTREGRVKVLDFGLAKQLPVEAPVAQGTTVALSPGQLTSRGMIFGTIGYMSPEQVRGDAVDARADIFSFGVVLFEMLTGKRAFDRDSAPETMAAILRDDPPMDEGSGRNLPPALRDLLDRCLEKKPDRRLPSMQVLSAELARLGPQPSSSNLSRHFFWPRHRVLWGAISASLAVLLAVAGLWQVLGRRTPVANEASIAVLPFEDMSEGKNQEYLSDGISEELLNLLAKIPALHVISRTSAFSFKGKHVGIPEIARQLKVAKILEGSVRRSGNRVRITAQLIDARTDTHLWSETYDRKIDDLFTVQDEIAAAVVGQLKVTLLGAPLKSQKVDPRAHDLYLQATQIARKGELGGTAQSIGLLKEALAITPDYASAWALLAWNYIAEVQYGTRSTKEGIGPAREAINKALTLDLQDARGYIRLADVEMNLEVNLASAAKHLERAWALDPVLASGGATDLARRLGRGELAIALAQFFAAHDPLNPFSYSNLGNAYSDAGHFDEALAHYRTALKLSPQKVGIHSQICLTLLRKGDAQGALAEIQREPAEFNRVMILTLIYQALGQTAKSDAALAEMIRKDGHDNPYNVAEALAFRRETDGAFEQLDKAVQIQDSGLADLATDELLANLHGDRRWLPLLRKLGQAPEQLAAIKFDVKPPTLRGRGN
jgi:serine/threonine protein kinase/tetratricopeptide (TPR) repeat protein